MTAPDQIEPGKRRGDWMQTFTGRCFWPLDPRPAEVCIRDIAHSLAMRCRYGGHSLSFYSVAEHSVLVSQQVPPEDALWALLHDAAEAYSADVPRPLKRCLPDWKPMEARIMRAVCTHFDLPEEEPASVKQVDLAITADEQAALMAPCMQPWGELPPPLGVTISGLGPEAAEALFLERFWELRAPMLVLQLRLFGQTPLEGTDIDPMIGAMQSLATEAGDAIDTLQRLALGWAGRTGDA